MSNRFRSFVLITFVLLTALSLPSRVRGATYSDVFPAALSNYAYGGWQGPFGDGTAGRLFPTSDGTGIYADATYNGLVWALRSSPEFASIDMTMHFSIPNRDSTNADYFALLLILHSPTTPPSTPPGTNCDGTCSYVTAVSGFKILYRIGFNQLVITNSQENITLSQVSLPSIALNQPHDARATYSSGNLTVYLDGVQLATVLTSSLPAGQVGLETYRTDLIVNTITLVGSPIPGFGLSVVPASATITPGSSTNATVTVASISGFTGTVALSATTSTPSFTATLNPSSVILASGSNLTSTLTVNTGSFCGNETVTVTGTSGSAKSSVTFALTALGPCAFNFSLATNPATLTIVAGAAGSVETTTATLVITGASTNPVIFTILSTLPSGVTASAFTNSPCSPTCSAIVTLTASATAPSTTSTLTIQAVGGGITHTATFTLVVTPPAPFDFALSIAPTTLTIVPGGASGVETATAMLIAGVSTSVTFSIATPLPAGVTAGAFTPASCGPTCSAIVALTASAIAPPGTTTLTVQAVGGGVTRTASFSVVVCACVSDFSLAATPSTLSITGGGPGGVETVTATLVAGVTTLVTFNIATPLPNGVTASAFTPASCSPTCSATVTLTASATAPASSSVITVQAVSGGLTRTTTFILVCCGSPIIFELAATPATLTITQGAVGGVETATATLATGATTAPVTFSILTAPPSGVAVSAFTNSPCSPTCSATVTFTASATAPASSTVITIQASGGSPVVTKTATFTLVVSGSFDFTLAASPSTLTITPGVAGSVETATVTLATGATATPVTFTISTTLPSGVTASAFTNSPCSPTCSATVTLTASATASASSTMITIQASSGTPTVTHTTTFTLVVSSCCDFTLAASPATLTITDGAAGGVETVIATLVAGTTPPFTFSFATTLPTGVTASAFTPTSCSPTCSATVTLTASSTAPASSTVLTIQAVGGGITRSTTFTLVVTGGVQDIDGDGIFNSVDTQPTVFSNDFSDIPLGGTTYGTILSRGDQCPTLPCQLTIQEASQSAGILITANPTGGLTPASISVCGGAAILSVSAGDVLTAKCGSVTVTVISGAVLATFVGSGSNAGIDGTATIIAGNGLTFQPATFGFAAPMTNIAIVTVIINGNSLPIAPGQITSSPFAVFTTSEVNPTGQVFSAGVVLKFDGSASFATVGPITRYTWNFGDGTILSNAASKVTHTYAVNGTYIVSLIVADNFGTSNSQSNTLNVLPAPIAGSETFSHNLFVSGDRLVQNVTVQVTNPNPYPILVNVLIAGNCDTACPFSDQSGPILLAAGQTKFISVVHTFSPLDQGQTFVMQVTVTFSTKTSNTDVGTYIPASSRTFVFTIK